MANILSTNQTEILNQLIKSNDITDHFYLSGGTALAEYYLQHRYSEDLDFFSESEVDSEQLLMYLKSLKRVVDIDFQSSFNRNLYFLKLDDGDIIKSEFTYYPFPQLDSSKKIENLTIDSLLDIAVNKAFTIYQNPRTRDFIDLYFILQREDFEYSFNDLLRKARMKFDFMIDPLNLGQQLQKVFEIKDYPNMLAELDDKDWQVFFIEESKKLKDSIFSE